MVALVLDQNLFVKLSSVALLREARIGNETMGANMQALPPAA